VSIAATAEAVAPRVLLGSSFNEMQAQFSPNGRWVAYTSDESDHNEVYVQSLGEYPRRVQISVKGGDDPRWRGDGKELFYVSPDGFLTAVAVQEQADAISVSPPQRLFRVRMGPARAPFLSSYDVAPDADHFVTRLFKDDVRSLPLTVVINPVIPTAR
jgi:hypothetical protein